MGPWDCGDEQQWDEVRGRVEKADVGKNYETGKVCGLWCTILLRPQMTGKHSKMGYGKCLKSVLSYIIHIFDLF